MCIHLNSQIHFPSGDSLCASLTVRDLKCENVLQMIGSSQDQFFMECYVGPRIQHIRTVFAIASGLQDVQSQMAQDGQI